LLKISSVFSFISILSSSSEILSSTYTLLEKPSTVFFVSVWFFFLRFTKVNSSFIFFIFNFNSFISLFIMSFVSLCCLVKLSLSSFICFCVFSYSLFLVSPSILSAPFTFF
jgi:hypothetical protein